MEYLDVLKTIQKDTALFVGMDTMKYIVKEWGVFTCNVYHVPYLQKMYDSVKVKGYEVVVQKKTPGIEPHQYLEHQKKRITEGRDDIMFLLGLNCLLIVALFLIFLVYFRDEKDKFSHKQKKNRKRIILTILILISLFGAYMAKSYFFLGWAILFYGTIALIPYRYFESLFEKLKKKEK